MEVGPRLVDERDVSRDISVDQGKHNTYRTHIGCIILGLCQEKGLTQCPQQLQQTVFL